jgi:hypothetical protein
MSPRISRRFALLAPALLGGLLWMGLPTAADAGGWKHGHHGHSKHHTKHHRKHDKHYYKYHHDHHYYPAPVAVSVYLDRACGHSYESWNDFSHHVHHHHGVAFVDLPGLLVQTSFGFAFHR